MKVLLSEDKAGYETHIAQDALAIPFIQEVVAMYNAMLLPAADGGDPQPLADLQPGELVQLYSDPQSFIFDKMTGGQAVSIAGLQVDKHKAISMLLKPTGYEALIAKIDLGKQSDEMRNGGNYPALTAGQIAPRYDIDESGTVVFKEDYEAKIEEQYKKYLTTDTAVQVNNFADAVVNAYNESGLAGKIFNPDGVGKFIQGLLSGENGNTFQKNEKRVLQFNNPEFRGTF